ncbi:MAG: nuclear transport factor 2 family protein [Thermosynechococcaceae cyanobacterium]
MNARAARETAVKRSLGFSCGLIATLATLLPVDLVVAQQTPADAPSPAPAVEAVPVSAPAEVTKTLQAMDEAASQQQMKRLLRFYSPEFSNSDGLNRQSMKLAIKDFWDKHQDLSYKTELLSWKADPQGGGIATTKTTITGNSTVADRKMALTATINSQQRWLNQQMVNQTITAEESQLVSGNTPPKVKVNLPNEVKVGETFNFDVIVSEPLDERLLLGTAVEESISAENYLKQPVLTLELLPAGGLFKVGQAPKKPTNEWISAVLVQDGGMIMISRRLMVVQHKSKAN